LNILVIDDSPTQRAVTKAFLMDKGYDVFEAPTHKEALIILHQEHIHLITLDWEMPDECPLDLVRNLRSGWKYFDLPVVMMTGRNQPEDVIEALNAGCDDFVTKDDGIEMLEIRIRRILSFLKRLDVESSQRDQRQILLIDDSKTFLATTRHFLEQHQFAILTADSGQKGLATLENNPVDLIVVDWMMPEMNGLEFIRHVRENNVYREIPIIMLSGKGAIEDVVAAIEYGADDFINKDMDLKLLEKKIGVLLRIQEQYRRYTRQIIEDKKKIEEMVVQRTQELKQTQTQLVQAEKMSSLGQMVAGIAHEINNPLSFVHNNLYIIKTDLEDIFELIEQYQTLDEKTEAIKSLEEEIDLDEIIDELNDVVENSSTGVQRIRDIVLSLRNFARLDEGERKIVDLYEGIDNSLMILNHKMKKGITIEKKYQPIPKLFCEAGKLNQVFVNLINNAADAIDDKGVITIEGYEENNHIVLIFSDTGSGIPKEYVGKIFEPFYTTKAVGEGTGLGLSIVYSIIADHDGDISVESEPGKTVFKIELPVDKQQ
jgi:two-component system NtrC family sensor kinase